MSEQWASAEETSGYYLLYNPTLVWDQPTALVQHLQLNPNNKKPVAFQLNDGSWSWWLICISSSQSHLTLDKLQEAGKLENYIPQEGSDVHVSALCTAAAPHQIL
jgi:hypothetical protein